MGNQESDILNVSRVYSFTDVNSFYNKTFKLLDEKREDYLFSLYLNGPNKHLSKIKGAKLINYQKMFERQDEIDSSKINLIITDGLLWILVKETGEFKVRLDYFENFLKDSIAPIEVTNKNFISYLFKENFSDNLLEILIDGEDIYDFESDFLFGSRLNKTIEYNNFIRTEGVYAVYLKLQPKGCNHSITLRNPNTIEFDKNMEMKDFNFLLIELSKKIEKMWS